MPGFSYICAMKEFTIDGVASIEQCDDYSVCNIRRDSYRFNFSGITPIEETDEGKHYLLSSVLQRDEAILRFIRIFGGEGAVVFFYTFSGGRHLPWRVPVKLAGSFDVEKYQHRRDYIDMRVMVTNTDEIICLELFPTKAINLEHLQ